MQTTSSVVFEAPRPSFVVRHQFLIYRLFSLCGLMPVGAYMCVHLLTNATILDSPATFQSNVDKIHSLGIVLPLVEWVFIFIPILFHAAVGWAILAGAVPNTSSYPYVGNVRYVLQRVTAIIAFVFIAVHVAHLQHTIGGPLRTIGGAQFDDAHAASSTATALQAALWIRVFYAVGVLACVYHFANGIWTLGITWGIWTTRAAQRRANYISAAVGLTMAIVGMSALWGMTHTDPEQARRIENRMQYGKELQKGEVDPPPLR